MNQQRPDDQDQAQKQQSARMQRMMRSAAGGGQGLVREIREFATRGNVLDLAIGVTVGATFSQGFSRLSSSLLRDVLAPLTGLISKIDLSAYYLNLSGRTFESLSQAKAAGAPVIAYGEFATQILDFGMSAGILMLLMRGLNRFKRGQEPEPVARECPFCLSSVPLKATRCRFCTSELPALPVAEAAAA
jgi:large conductance mechanosensitive channel